MMLLKKIIISLNIQLLRKKDTVFRGHLSAYFIKVISSIVDALLKTQFNSEHATFMVVPSMQKQVLDWSWVCFYFLGLTRPERTVRNNQLAAKALTDGQRSKEGSSPDHVCTKSNCYKMVATATLPNLEGSPDPCLEKLKASPEFPDVQACKTSEDGTCSPQ